MTFCFVVLADSQLGMMATNINRGIFIPKDDSLTAEKSYELEKQMLCKAVRCINKMQPKPVFVVVCGDLVDIFPNTEEQVRDFKTIMAQLDPSVALVCVCGNHDIGDRPTSATIAAYKERFGDDYFPFRQDSIKFLVLNSQLFKDSSLCPDLAKAHSDWIDKELASVSPGDRVIVFSHIPPCIHTPDEPDGYFNLSTSVRAHLFPRLIRAGAKAWFCGHFHRNSIAVVNGIGPDGIATTMEVVVNGAIGTNLTTRRGVSSDLELAHIGTFLLDEETSGLRVVTVTEEDISHQWFSLASLDDNKL
eukprot:c2015_g1_i1.p1 GENE.c2015_g1_i1~~c2015_g1_i1.p1  ORF type:complete len:304 (+),score=51.05 c2015_g1_i1:77-988(+)